jgi:hypothetical protein
MAWKIWVELEVPDSINGATNRTDASTITMANTFVITTLLLLGARLPIDRFALITSKEEAT